MLDVLWKEEGVSKEAKHRNFKCWIIIKNAFLAKVRWKIMSKLISYYIFIFPIVHYQPRS